MKNMDIFYLLLVGLMSLLIGFKYCEPALGMTVKVNKYGTRIIGIVCTTVGIVGLIAKLFGGC
jgi:hypothetical protein